MKMMRVPVLPSSEVIFPGQLFAVPRGIRVIDAIFRHCHEHQRGLGVVFVSGTEGRTIANVGTLANLVDPGLSLDRTDQAETYVAGQYRFRIHQIHQDHAFLEATVSVWPWIEEPPPDWALVESVGWYLGRYVEALSNVLPPVLLPDALPPGASTLGILSAGLLQIPNDAKQRLLETPTTCALMASVLDYMRVYVPLAERLAEMPAVVPKLDEYAILN